MHSQGQGAVYDETDTTTDEDGVRKQCRKHQRRRTRAKERQTTEEERRKRDKVIQRMITLLQMFAVVQFGCGNREVFKSNTMKQTTKGNHWGDMRAKLELAVDKVLRELDAIEAKESAVNSDYASESDEAQTTAHHEQLTIVVRKEFASCLRDLLQHGLEGGGGGRSLVPSIMGCFATRSGASGPMLHIWDLILKYYFFKNGPQYNASPARKLSESFNLDIVSGATAKQTLLGVIHNIICSHTPLRRSPDSHFKAFVCAALNEKRLTAWLKMILRCKPIVERYYAPWSYVRKTGFEDAYRSIDRLTSHYFSLPVDLAVKQLQEIKDAF